jgi:Fic family protein
MKAPDIMPQDRGEAIALMEPLLIPAGSRHREALNDLAIELAARSAGFRHSLPEGIVAALADLVRSMNCYYSNLIEGHNTHPVDIERALNDDFSSNSQKRDLQLEARAHITVQRWIDNGGLRGQAYHASSICEIHQRFCAELPDDLLWVETPDSDRRTAIVPGEFRQQDVRVGQHVAISPGALPRFFARFEQVFARLGKADTIIATAAAHHRLLWIHPFVDGNGRVARLASHAVLLEQLDSGGIWSIARGLARQEAEYKRHLAACDQTRRNDLDGRGHLSEENLAAFSLFFLNTCLDQVSFMQDLVQPDRLRDRVLFWAAEAIRMDELPPKAERILEAILYRGELARGEVAGLVDTGDRHARRLVASLVDKGLVTSHSSRAPLRLAFPAKLASRWMPGLFPDQA